MDEQVEHKGGITMMVRADGLPKPEIKWYCNAKPLSDDENHSIETTNETQVTSKLTIKCFEEENGGIVSIQSILTFVLVTCILLV